MIIPTVGRKVWYYENTDQKEPFDGTIVRVFDDAERNTPDALVNVFIIEPGGNTRLIPMIRCQAEGFPGPHYRWMPFQLSQAGATPVVPAPVPEPAPTPEPPVPPVEPPVEPVPEPTPEPAPAPEPEPAPEPPVADPQP